MKGISTQLFIISIQLTVIMVLLAAILRELR